MVLRERIELSTSPLPRECSTTELPQQAGVGPGSRRARKGWAPRRGVPRRTRALLPQRIGPCKAETTTAGICRGMRRAGGDKSGPAWSGSVRFGPAQICPLQISMVEASPVRSSPAGLVRPQPSRYRRPVPARSQAGASASFGAALRSRGAGGERTLALTGIHLAAAAAAAIHALRRRPVCWHAGSGLLSLRPQFSRRSARSPAANRWQAVPGTPSSTSVPSPSCASPAARTVTSSPLGVRT